MLVIALSPYTQKYWHHTIINSSGNGDVGRACGGRGAGAVLAALDQPAF
jgi:hypothetical protein